MFYLEPHSPFPPLERFPPDDLVAIGGSITPENIITAYKLSMFPWYNQDEPIQWWSPDPRCILYPADLIISKSMLQVIRKEKFTLTYNQHFKKVIQLCGTVKRKEGDGTWINDDIIETYSKLHKMGIGISAEVYEGDQLVGGLYGLKIGNIFFGESMFSLTPNASKFAFIKLTGHLQSIGVVLIDCQIESSHLRSLGATLISRKAFQNILTLHTAS